MILRCPRRRQVAAALAFALGTMISTAAPGQESPAAKAAKPLTRWERGLVASMTFTQNTFTHWEEGGTSSAAWAWTLTGDFDRLTPGFTWANDVRLEYGLTKQQQEAIRKSVDLIGFETVLTRHLDYLVQPFVGFELKTQFTRGRDYGADPDPGGQFPASSSFADPLYLVESAGVGRQLNPYLSSRAGFAVTETVTDEFRRYACTKEETAAISDPEERDRLCDRTRVETGLESVTKYKRTLGENTVLDSRVRLFYSFEQTDQLDVHWRTKLDAELLRYVNFTLTLELLYDEDVSSRLQLKQLLGLGLSFAVI